MDGISQKPNVRSRASLPFLSIYHIGFSLGFVSILWHVLPNLFDAAMDDGL